MTEKAIRKTKNGVSHSRLLPARKRSINSFEKTGLITLISADIKDTSTVKVIAADVPRSWFAANSNMLFLFPPRSKFSVGSKKRHTPVKPLSKSSRESSTVPLAGSLTTTLSFLKPHTTIK